MARIAYISSTFPDFKGCGVGIYAGYLTNSLAQLGHDVHVITSAIPEIRPTFGKVTVHKLLKSWQPTELYRLAEAFHRIRPDIIHINHPTKIAAGKSKVLVNMLPEINRALWRKPLVTTLHEFGRVSLLGKLKILPMLTGSDVITVTSRYYKDVILKFSPKMDPDKIEIVNIGSMFQNALPKVNRQEQRQRWGLRPDDKVVGFMGFITPPKGFHNLIEAMAPFMKADRKIKILALSSWNQSEPAYRQLILNHIEGEGLSAQVIFTGFLEDNDMWNSLEAVNLCAFPFDLPVEERSSGPLRQSIDRGLATVTFAQDSKYDEFGFKHGHNIWFSPFKNLKVFGEDVVKLLNDINLQIQIGKGAHELRSVFSFDNVSNAMSRIYQRLGRA
jgi:glycosyltransferase involved in cell wall biosynthesis